MSNNNNNHLQIKRKKILCNLKKSAISINELYLNNQQLNSQIDLYKKLIVSIKKSIQNYKFIEVTNQFKNLNSSLKEKYLKILKKYEKKNEEMDLIVVPLQKTYEELKNDNFILSNSIQHKQNIILLLEKNINDKNFNIEEHEKFIDENPDALKNRGKTRYEIKIEQKQSDELKKCQEILSNIAKRSNKISKHRNQLLTEKNSLENEINQIRSEKKNLTEYNNNNSFLIFRKKNKFPTYSQSSHKLNFSKFENNLDFIENQEFSHTTTINDTHIENEFDLFGNQTFTRKNKSQNKNKIKIDKVTGTNLQSSQIEEQVPKLDLNQIEYNKSKIEIEVPENLINEIYDNYKSTFKYKIAHMKRKVNKEKAKQKKYLNIINEFELYFNKMPLYDKYYYNLIKKEYDNKINFGYESEGENNEKEMEKVLNLFNDINITKNLERSFSK